MKTVIIFLIFLGIVLGRLTEDQLLVTDTECIKELGMNIETVLNNINNKLFITEGIPEINNFMLCAVGKLNGYNESTKILDFKILKPALIHYANVANGGVVNQEELVEEACKYCKDIQGLDDGDQVIKIVNCIMKYVNQ